MFKKEKYRYYVFEKFNFKLYVVLKILKLVNMKNMKENFIEYVVS